MVGASDYNDTRERNMRNSTSGYFHNDAGWTENDRLACGGGKSCSNPDGIHHLFLFDQRGNLRCKDCAVRLGWVDNASWYDQKRQWRWKNGNVNPSWADG
jgi:hypothetical protein